MPRTVSRGVRGFIWRRRTETPEWDIKIDSISVRPNVLSSEFTRAIAPEIGSFKFTLENSNEEYSNKFVGDEVVEMYSDLASGTTKRFKGKIDMIKKKFNTSGFHIELSGGHLSSELLNIHVTESYNGDKTCDEIYIDIVGKYLTGYTTTNVTSSTKKPTINWNNKPFWECVYDLCLLAKDGTQFVSYIDDDKDCHFFEKGTVENNSEAFVWNDTLIEVEGLGTETLNKRDKVIIIGDDGSGLPVISTSGSGTKEEVIFDTKIDTVLRADELAIAQLSLKNVDETEGKAKGHILPSLVPGDRIYIIEKPSNIHGQFNIYKYTHNFPDERTEVFVETDRSVPQIFRRRVETELAQQTITNPFKMTGSWNFKFDDFSELSSWDSNIAVEDGKIKLSSGSQGTFTSNTFTIAEGIKEVHLLVVADNLNATIKLSTDGGSVYETLSIGVKKILNYPVDVNAQCVLQVIINSSTTEIDSLAILYK